MKQYFFTIKKIVTKQNNTKNNLCIFSKKMQQNYGIPELELYIVIASLYDTTYVIACSYIIIVY